MKGRIKGRIEDRKSSIPTSNPNGNAFVFSVFKRDLKGRIEQAKSLSSSPSTRATATPSS